MLDQATNELAHLLNHLDLEATPSPARTSLSGSDAEKRIALITQSEESPVKKGSNGPASAIRLGPRASSASITSLRPYAQSRGVFTKGITTPTVQPSELYGQPIAPWKVLNSSFSPPRLKTAEAEPTQTVHPDPLVAKQAQSSSRAPEPPLVFEPLGPASKKQMKTLKMSGMPREALPPTPLTIVPSAVPLQVGDDDRSPSTNTFGSAPSSPVSHLGHSPVFKRKRHSRQRSSLGQYELLPMAEEKKRNSIPIEPEGRKILGLSGTMGASTTPEPTSLDFDNPDSDIPHELQAIIAACSDDDAGSISSSTTTSMEVNVPSEALPTYDGHLNDDSASLDIDGEGSVRGEDDTTKSFDFTGELAKLNESGAGHRQSFVEQLENAFRTPAKINLRYDFGLSKTSLVEMEIPPVPRLPSIYATEANLSTHSDNLPFMEAADHGFDRPDPEVPQDISCVDASLECLSSTARAVDVSIPFIQTDSLMARDEQRAQDEKSLRSSRYTRSILSKASDGCLDLNFKFGGSSSPYNDASSIPLTLSDIIPPLPEARRLSNISVIEQDDSILKPFIAPTTELPTHLDPPPVSHAPAESDTNSVYPTRENMRESAAYDHSRRESALSFFGLESFDEVRRGFEFNNSRPGFYPTALAEYDQSQLGHSKHDSAFSIPSVSSYGAVLRPGLPDPFEYGITDTQSRRISDDMSMSVSVDDTFDFVKRNQRRTRVDSDASSFYFRPSLAPLLLGRVGSHRNRDSIASVTSVAPPISIYNRSFGAHTHNRNSSHFSHRRDDSDVSASSVALSYAMHGASSGRPVSNHHWYDVSTDSIFSDSSTVPVIRPGLGDKMFQSLDYGRPLASISASPDSVASNSSRNCTSYQEHNPTGYCDSLIDEFRLSSLHSVLQRTRNRTSVSSESIFGTEEAKASAPIPNPLAPPFQFRPLSMTSLSDDDYNSSILNADKANDTLITVSSFSQLGT
jgi:serine/arginine repetitive matrix protein 2